MVPLSARRSLPGRATAPVNAPFATPKSSLASSVSTIIDLLKDSGAQRELGRTIQTPFPLNGGNEIVGTDPRTIQQDGAPESGNHFE